jgi:hypothetical protein
LQAIERHPEPDVQADDEVLMSNDDASQPQLKH